MLLELGAMEAMVTTAAVRRCSQTVTTNKPTPSFCNLNDLPVADPTALEHRMKN